VHCRWREWEGKWGKLLLNVGETDSPEPVTGVTGCDGPLVTGCWWPACWWRLGRVEGWRSTRHRVWRPSPWSWIPQDLFLSSFSRRISLFLRMEAFIAVYLKHVHTTQHNIGKTRESRPKLHTKRAEIMLCFTYYQFLPSKPNQIAPQTRLLGIISNAWPNQILKP